MDRLLPFFAPPAARARPRGEEAARPHPKKGPATLLGCRPQAVEKVQQKLGFFVYKR